MNNLLSPPHAISTPTSVAARFTSKASALASATLSNVTKLRLSSIQRSIAVPPKCLLSCVRDQPIRTASACCSGVRLPDPITNLMPASFANFSALRTTFRNSGTTPSRFGRWLRIGSEFQRECGALAQWDIVIDGPVRASLSARLMSDLVFMVQTLLTLCHKNTLCQLVSVGKPPCPSQDKD